MRILIIKTSSMGDIIHTLPALTDAANAIPTITFDWVVEENFAEIPAWHPRVDKVIPVALRRWRKNIFSAKTRAEWKLCREQLRANQYDLIIDGQGLLKSGWLAFFAKGIRCGLDWNSARERLASLFYQRKFAAGEIKKIHAVTRMRKLFALALGYDIPTTVPDYGLPREQFFKGKNAEKYCVFLHGTTWTTKHWPEEYWIELAKLANRNQLLVKLPWGNQSELERAQRIQASCERVEVLPRMKLAEIASVLAGATGIVAVDTGLCHLAAALDVPTVSLYGPSDPALSGAMGRSQVHLSAKFVCAPCFRRECTYPEASLYSVKPPCFSTLPPAIVWEALAANSGGHAAL